MGPEATADFYLRIIRIFQKEYGAVYDDDFPEIVILNLPWPDVVEATDNAQAKQMLIDGAKRLASTGVDFIAIPCNTVNFCLKDMRDAIDIPIISIVEETAKEAKQLGLDKVGIICTEMTIRENLYGLQLHIIKLITPTNQEQEIVTKTIVNVLRGEKSEGDRQLLQGIIKRLQREGAQRVILGCTELPLLIANNDDVLDTLDILARATVKKAIRALNVEE